MRIDRRVVVALIALALVAVACGDGGDGSGSTAAGVDDGGVGAETAATGPTGTTAEVDVQVSLNNYLFDPNPVEVTSGDVVAVRNANTKTPHTFTVVGQDVDLELGPLETETVEIALEPGTYNLICRFHEQLGMTAGLVVG